ncbi:hypothetical protein [Bosea sp. CS1GBMeth4]|uniref:hypothetical protein n=1 Tax=Bosea sp. CS1GBMeth4 TaxID=1892849 RepID=UPI001649499F|nr:hypothetical protein [Bosea sp. CS1GBMeth4]
MTIALVIAVPAYLLVASLVALNCVLEAERPAFTATDAAIVALISAAWPAAGLLLLSMQAVRGLLRGRRPVVRAAPWRPFRSG